MNKIVEFNINHMSPVLFGPDTSLQTVATRAVTEGPAMFSPRKVDASDILQILEKAYDR